MLLHVVTLFLMTMLPAVAVAAESGPGGQEVTSVVGEVVVSTGSLKTDSKAKKELESIARRLAKIPGQKMIEIEGAYPSASGSKNAAVAAPESREEYFSKSFLLAMEVEGYIRGTLGVQQDYYLSARSQKEHSGSKPLVRIVLHTGNYEKQALDNPATMTPQMQPASAVATQPAPLRPQVTPTIGLDGTGQQVGQIQQFDPAAYDTGPIDERLVAEQARRATQLIEQTKAKAAERDRRRAAEEKAASKDLIPLEKPQQ